MAKAPTPPIPPAKESAAFKPNFAVAPTEEAKRDETDLIVQPSPPKDAREEGLRAGKSLDEEVKAGLPFSPATDAIANEALAAKGAEFDPEDPAYLSTRWVQYCRDLGNMGDWENTTSTQQAAFKRLIKNVVADARRAS
jgi:hypothetical protein